MKTEKRFVCTIDEEDGELVTLKMAPVDLVALLKLADELDKDAEDIVSSAKKAQFTGSGPKIDEAKHEAYQLHRIAHRIKKALGVDDA